MNRACHALAIDDERRTFHPELWDERVPSAHRFRNTNACWDATGSRETAASHRSGSRARTPTSGRLCEARHVARDAALDDAACRDGWAGFSPLDEQCSRAPEPARPPLRLPSRPRASYRYRPRELGGICAERGIDAPRVHVSAIDRVAFRTEGYAPGNIPPGSEIVSDRTASDVLKKINSIVNTTLAGGLPLDSARGLVAVRKVGYSISLITTLALAGWLICRSLRTQDWSSTAAALVSLSGIGGLVWDLFKVYPIPVAILILIIAGSWYTTLRAHRAMHDRFADVWRTTVDDLRHAR